MAPKQSESTIKGLRVINSVDPCVLKFTFLNDVRTSLRPVRAWFLEIDLVRELCVCVSMCPPPRLVITSGVIWTPYDWLNKYYSFCMAAIVGIVSRCGLRIEARRRNQPNKSKLVLYKPLLRLCSHLKQPYISKKIKHCSYKGGCGVHGWTRIEAFKRRAGLGYI